MPSFFRKSANQHDPNEVAVVMDISGYCDHCHRRGNARLVAYYSREIIIRCNQCKTAGAFTPDDATYNDPSKFLPFREDRDDDPDPDAGSGRYTRGVR